MSSNSACHDCQRHGLCCLFPEALENICRYLSLPEIQLVCCLCRRLNRSVVDVLLASNGILDPTVECHIRLDGTSDPAADSSSALVALQYALSIPSMEQFAVTFTGNSDTPRMVQNMRRCRRVLLKFPSIRDVIIEFQEIEYDARFLTSGGLKYPLKNDFQALLDTIQGLPSLKSLRVATGWDFDSNYMLELFPSVVGVHSISPPVGSALLKKAHKIYKGILSRSRPLPSPPSRRTPITFLIDTPILVLPSFYPWTISILSCRAITSLRLHMLIAAVDWPIILREIAEAVPYLTELTILGVRMPVPALMRIVSMQFRDLSSLTMDSAPDFFTEPSFRAITMAPVSELRGHKRSSTLIPKTYLSNLTSLAVRPEHLEFLLKPYEPLPALASLCVRLEILDLTSPGMPSLMRGIAMRLRSTHKSIAPLLVLDVRANVSPEALMCRTLDIALSKGIEWEEAFGSIENLRVRDYGAYNCVILARWLTVFRGATKISLAGISGSPASLERTMSEIYRTCPQVRSVTVEGTSRGLPGSGQELAGRTSGFLELPDDVLLIILGQLGSVELYGVSRLTRRLNLLALPLYFAQKGVSDPSQWCELRLVNSPAAADVLSALNSALFLREVKHISCHFKSGGYVFCYLNHIQRLTAFLAKFPSVEKVSLELADLGHVDSEVNEVVQAK
ncbi:Ribonuclease H-like protein [Mycena venus]|uniref:Ribonuclease H-like protein n=1 Tax=Mycena venus TaxID=2733690 RepID=A0A8H7D3F0_9AGAR|nr:Ribonuclease H-like protein [Mycena venus]